MSTAYLSLKGLCWAYRMTPRQVDLILENHDIRPDRFIDDPNPLFEMSTVNRILTHKTTMQEKKNKK